MVEKLWLTKLFVFRRLLLVILLTGALQAWWTVAPGATAEEPPAEKLALTIAPPILAADGGTKSVVYVQLIGSNGIPTLASNVTEVSLFSSDPRIVSVLDRVHISSGQSFAVASLTTTTVAGKAEITAIGRGLASVTAQVETVNPLGSSPPFHLALYAAPVNIIPNGRPLARLSIVLLQNSEVSLPAPFDVNVVLSSSNPETVAVPSHAVILKGEHFTTIDLEALDLGSATLSAVSSGFVSRFIQVQVVETGEKAEALVLYPSPPVLRAGTNGPGEVIVQAIDNEGLPVYFPCTQISLASSSVLSAEVAPLTEIDCGRNVQYAKARVSVGNLPGTSTISAAATGLRPTTGSLKIDGQVPRHLKVYQAPAGLLATESSPGYLIIQVLDESGLPVVSHDDIPVRIVSQDESLPEQGMISRELGFLRIELKDLEPGNEVELLVLSPNLTPDQITLRSHTLPANVELETSERPAFPGDERLILVRAQSSGNPLSDASLNWSATGGDLSNASDKTNENGEGSALFTAMEVGDATVEVVLSRAGYEEASTQISVAVVVAGETDESGPRLIGIPVLFLTDFNGHGDHCLFGGFLGTIARYLNLLSCLISSLHSLRFLLGGF